ncbi:hypothetical protein [Photobacterium sp. GB-72]|uniref:hypothetical protein n=1 Tax=Photobacterium sp. GB-72 TaxID=2022105 RepID=UPI000D1712E2|nr:hypothetical protein [Photobacterium sp. GB-72]PSV28093.1 hypothetical protein C9J40_19630 [Photobacterium sp. GB-72]
MDLKGIAVMPKKEQATINLQDTNDDFSDLVLFCFTFYPNGADLTNYNNVEIKTQEIKRLAKKKVNDLLGEINCTLTNKPTMFLLAAEVEEIRKLLLDTLNNPHKRVAKIPDYLESYHLVFPSRYYLAIRLSSLSTTQKMILF